MRQPFFIFLILSLVALFITSLIYSRVGNSSTQEITYSQFLELVNEDQVESVVFDGDRIQITLKEDSDFAASEEEDQAADYYYQATGQRMVTTYYTAYINDEELLPLLKEHRWISTARHPTPRQ